MMREILYFLPVGRDFIKIVASVRIVDGNAVLVARVNLPSAPGGTKYPVYGVDSDEEVLFELLCIAVPTLRQAVMDHTLSESERAADLADAQAQAELKDKEL